MVWHHHYSTPTTPAGAGWDISVTQVRGEDWALVTDTQLGSAGTGGIWVDDPAASQDFVGQKQWYVTEDAGLASLALTGTVAKAAASATITGTGTLFLTELAVNQTIIVPGGTATEYLVIAAIASNTSLTVAAPALYSASGQTATRASNQRLWTGYTGDQLIERGMSRRAGGEIMGNGRDWSIDLTDVNTFLHFRIIQAGDGASAPYAKRPAETASARMAWFLSIDHIALTLYDEGLVNWTGLATFPMDPANYTGRFEDEFLNEISQVTGYNHSVFYREASGHYELLLDLVDSVAGPTGRTFDSSAKLSNLASDIAAVPGSDGIWPTWSDGALKRSAKRVPSGVYVSGSGITAYRTRIATSYVYGWRDVNAPNANLKTAAKANAYGDRYLLDNSTQDRVLSLTWTPPAAHVNDILPGQRVQVKQTHLPGLSDFTWCRVLRRTVRPHIASNGEIVPGVYDVPMDLSPTKVCYSGTIDVLGDSGAPSWTHGVAPITYTGFKPSTTYTWKVSAARIAGSDYGYAFGWFLCSSAGETGGLIYAGPPSFGDGTLEHWMATWTANSTSGVQDITCHGAPWEPGQSGICGSFDGIGQGTASGVFTTADAAHLPAGPWGFRASQALSSHDGVSTWRWTWEICEA